MSRTMNKWFAEAVLTRTWPYRLCRKYRTINVISFLFLPVLALIIVVLGPIVAPVYGVIIGGLKELRESELYRSAFPALLPRWTKKNEELDALIEQARKTLEQGNDSIL